MKIGFAFALFLLSATAYGQFVFGPLTEGPPKAEDIGEIMFDRSDVSMNNSQYITIPRETFLRFFKEGKFNCDGKFMDEILKMPPDLNEKKGRNYCTGHFATRGGKVYEFNRYNPRALEISDAQYRMGWLILPGK